ncbi:MAG: hypothetical protein JW803_03135 [Endomicrobiales bacterium]|nr:hypothetical protein [Endomicrobiales bacterium]
MNGSKNVLFLSASIIFLASLFTLPRIFINYGVELDAVLGPMAAERLVETGAYTPSRFPGNPLFEYILALITAGGGNHAATNIFVFLSYLISIVFFFRIVREYEQRHILTFLYSLTPIILLNAATTIDYIPGLACVLASYMFLKRGAVVFSALSLAAAVGFRPTNAAFLVPFSVFMLLSGNRKRVHVFILFSFAAGALFYVPIICRFGILPVISVPPSPLSVFQNLLRAFYNLAMLFGPLATALLVLLAALAVLRGAGASSEADINSSAKKYVLGIIPSCIKLDSDTVVGILAVLVFVFLFFMHPDETAYLIPAVPFLYVLLPRFLNKKSIVVLTAVILLHGFFTIELKGGSSGKRSVVFRPSHGILMRDYILRKDIEEIKKALGTAEWPPKTVVMTGDLPLYTYKNTYAELEASAILPGFKLKGRDVYFVSVLCKESVEGLLAEGYRIYVFSESAPTTAINLFGYDPSSYDITVLKVLSGDSFWRDLRSTVSSRGQL